MSFSRFRERWSTRWWLVTALVVLVCAPIVVAIVTLWSRAHWYPAGDMAQAELHLRGFWSDPPLVGAAGRIVGHDGTQGSHPGPGLWVAMWPVYFIGGRTSGALMAAVGSVHITSVFLILAMAWRRGGKLLTIIFGFVVLLLIRSSGPDFMIEPWNPWLAILPFVLFVFLLGEVVAPVDGQTRTGRSFVFVAAVAVGSYCIQCHAGYIIVVAAGLVGAAAVLVFDERDWRLVRTLAFKTLIVGLVMWLPPTIDQLRRSPGNFSLLWQNFAAPAEPTIAWSKAADIVASQMNIVGPWLTGPGSNAPAETWARYLGCLVFVAVWAMSTWLARSKGMNDLYRIQLMLAGGFAVGSFAVSRIFGPYFEYTIRWFWILTALSLGVAVGIFLRVAARSPREFRGFVKGRDAGLLLGLAGVVALTVTSSVQAYDRVHLPGPTESQILGDLIPQVVGQLDKSDEYLLHMYDPYTLNATGFGSVLELERRGYQVGVDWFFAAAALPSRVAYAKNVDRELWIVVGPAIERADNDAALVNIGFTDPRTASEQIAARQLMTAIRDGLIEAGRSELVSSLETPGASLLFAEPPLPTDVAELVRQLILLGQPVAMYTVVPGMTPTSLE